jgi:hypothetical protein
MKAAGLVAAVLMLAACSNPMPLTATVEAAATENVAVSGRAQFGGQADQHWPNHPPTLDWSS